MAGAFGGSISVGDTSTTETVDAALAALLAGSDPAPLAPELVPVRSTLTGPAELVYEGDLRGLTPLELPSPGGVRAALRTLEQALGALAALHAAGRPHGDLRPGHVWTGERTRVSFPAKAVDANLLLRARLRAGAEPADTDYVAPEVLRGEPATAASDVYSIAALVHAAFHGHAPHGRALPLPRLAEPIAGLDRLVTRALDADPARRPALAELAFGVSASLDELRKVPASDGPRVSLVTSPEGATPVQVAATKSDGPVILGCLLTVGGFFVLFGAIWLAVVSWSAIGEVGRLGLLAVVTGGIAIAGLVLQGRGYLRSGLALLTLATQLIWANGAYLIVLLHHEDEVGSWCLLAWLVVALTEVLALGRKSALLASVAVIDAAIAALLLGGVLSTGSSEGPALWALVTGAILAGFGVLGHRVGGLALGLPGAVGALGFAIGSWALGFAVHLDFFSQSSPVAFATVWPYVVLALSIALALGLSHLGLRTYALVAALGVGLFLTTTPTIEALAHWKEVPYRYAATTIGALLVIAAFKAPRLADDPGIQLLAVISGLASLTVAPALVCVGQLVDRNGDLLLGQIQDLDMAGRLAHPFFSLSYLVMTAGSLVVLGVLFARDAERKVPYRALEVAGLLAFFGPLTLLSITDWTTFLYPALVFGGGLAALGVGAWQRHLLLVTLPASFLLLNAWIQYFAKLKEAFPLALLLMGFGISVLAAGILFERKVKPFLPALKTWA